MYNPPRISSASSSGLTTTRSPRGWISVFDLRLAFVVEVMLFSLFSDFAISCRSGGPAWTTLDVTGTDSGAEPEMPAALTHNSIGREPCVF